MIFEDLNFLNKPAIRFKRPKAETLDAFYADIYKKFKEDEDAGEIWKNEVFDALINKDRDKFNQLVKEGGKVIYYDEVIDILIDKYTLAGGITEEEQENYKRVILEGEFVKDIEFKHNPEQIIFTTESGKYKVSKLSDIFKPFKKYRDIENENRHGLCHSQAVGISISLRDKNKIATGYIYTFGEGFKVLHSWIEIKIDGQDYVIDVSRNMIAPKKFYYLIRNIEGSVYKISSETMKKEKEIFDYLKKENVWLSKIYLSNRRQALQVYKILKDKEKETNNQSENLEKD